MTALPIRAAGRANLSRTVAVIPVRSLEGAKSRLGEQLDAEERHALVTALLVQAVGAASEASGVGDVVVVSPDEAALAVATERGAAIVRQASFGLNEGLEEARAWAGTLGASALLVLPPDLPFIDAVAIEQLLDRAADACDPDRPLVVLVPDRHGRGTNALLISPPDAIPFRFGSESLSAHRAAAEQMGAVFVELDGPLSLDLDTPEDLLLAEPRLFERGAR